MSGSAKRTVRPKHIPQRSCVVCRIKLDKRQLTRLVYQEEADGLGVLKIDPTGKQHGRGAYLCPNPACWAKMVQGKQLDNALRTTLTHQQKADLLTYYQTNLAPPRDPVTAG